MQNLLKTNSRYFAKANSSSSNVQFEFFLANDLKINFWIIILFSFQFVLIVMAQGWEKSKRSMKCTLEAKLPRNASKKPSQIATKMRPSEIILWSNVHEISDDCQKNIRCNQLFRSFLSFTSMEFWGGSKWLQKANGKITNYRKHRLWFWGPCKTNVTMKVSNKKISCISNLV